MFCLTLYFSLPVCLRGAVLGAAEAFLGAAVLVPAVVFAGVPLREGAALAFLVVGFAEAFFADALGAGDEPAAPRVAPLLDLGALLAGVLGLFAGAFAFLDAGAFFIVSAFFAVALGAAFLAAAVLGAFAGFFLLLLDVLVLGEDLAAAAFLALGTVDFAIARNIAPRGVRVKARTSEISTGLCGVVA